MVSAATILIATYNRADRLRETLAAIRALGRPRDCRTEVVVVDNNSSDATRAVVDRAAGGADIDLVYEFEPRQGKSFALNRGLARASGDVIVLTDDDVLPAADWLERIVAVFRARPALSFAFGKVLPRWEVTPPAMLLSRPGQEVWGPLALVDYGDEAEDYGPTNFGTARFPIGANLSFSRAALEAVGGWRPDLGKVDNSLISGEDFEIFFRLRAAGLYSGLYDPKNLVRHYVPASRLTHAYFRRWFFWQGRTIARLLPETYPAIDFDSTPLLAGAPRFIYRQCLRQQARWLASLAQRDRLRRLVEEMYCCRYLGILYECWQCGGIPRGERARTSSATA